jgi:hypothetical protein
MVLSGNRGFQMAAQEKESFREKPLAPESLKTRRAREKLLKAWEAEKNLFTAKAIEETVDKIHKWIADNAKYRVPIKEKNIKLFNQNQNAAAISKKVQGIADKLKADMAQFGKGAFSE